MNITFPKELVFATNNRHKLEEAAAILGSSVRILSLQDIDCREELPETKDTFEGNALQKARYICDRYGVDCFADDSGLEVDALGGAPGVYSARYALLKGAALQAHDDAANTRQLLRDLEEFSVFGRKILAGVSRKSMIYKKFGITPEESLPQTQVLHFAALQNGADILRVHDVAEAVRTVAMYRILS